MQSLKKKKKSLKAFSKRKATNKFHHSWKIIWKYEWEWMAYIPKHLLFKSRAFKSCSLYMYTTSKEKKLILFSFWCLLLQTFASILFQYTTFGSITANKRRPQFYFSSNFNVCILRHHLMLEVGFGEDRHHKLINTSCNSHATHYYLIPLSEIQLLQNTKIFNPKFLS